MVLGDLEFYLINHKWFSISFSYRQAKHQYLEVNFTCKVKINRLVTKGHGENYVKSFFLFYSKDGRIFKPYKLGSKNMVSELPWDDLFNNKILIIQFENVCPPRGGLDGFHFLHKSLPFDSMSEHSYVKTDPSAESKSCNLLLLVVHWNKCWNIFCNDRLSKYVDIVFSVSILGGEILCNWILLFHAALSWH